MSKGFGNASSGISEQAEPHSWMENMASSAIDTAKPNIIIVIDDVTSRTVGRVIDAAGNNPITMAFLPDKSTQSDLDQAKSHGHDSIIHMPMEPLDKSIGLETSTLKTDYNSFETGIVLNYALKDFNGYIGINNHMGSAAMQNPRLLDRVMSEMSDRGLLFLDSKTISASKFGKENSEMAKNVAEEHGVDYVQRKIFLDHEQTEDYVEGQLSKIEAIAQRDGSVIAIGHPHGVTMEALKEWMPEASEKFNFITLGAHAASELGLNSQNELDNSASPSPSFDQPDP